MKIIQQTFEYIVRLANISVWYYVVAVTIGIIAWLKWKKPNVGFLVAYCLIVFSIAVLSRKIRNYPNNFILFFKYKQGINNQILANIIIFIPIGAILTSISWKWIWIGPVFSVLIELSQLFFHRGMFDVDDIVSNSLGVIVASIAMSIFQIVLQRMKNV